MSNDNTPEGDLLHQWSLSDGDTLAVRGFDLDPFIRSLIAPVTGPVLQIGSKADLLDSHARWRNLFPDQQFVGLDLEDGDNVDVVADIAAKPELLRRKTGITQFGFIICAHVLEHVRKPWEAARNIQFLLKPGGYLFVAVPWVQGYHPYPEDYWRMSFAGLRELFDKIDVETEFYSGAAEDVGYQLLRNGATEHTAATCRIERNPFQISHDVPPDEEMFGPCLSGYHPHPLYVVCLLGLQARAGAGALRRRSG